MITLDDIKAETWLSLSHAMFRESARCSVAEIVILQYIIENPRCSIMNIGEEIYDLTDGSSASELAKRWSLRGIIEIRKGNYSDGNNRAKTSIILTPKAQRMLKGEIPIKFELYVRNRNKFSSSTIDERNIGGYVTD